MQRRPNVPQEEHCPVPEHMLGQLYRASSDVLDALIASVPSGSRAMLAMYCYRRTHLQSIGLAIATSCQESELRDLGGYAGSVLYEKARETPDHTEQTHYQARQKVTLSSGILKDFLQADHDDISVENLV
jgi:hypothetical protein